MSTHFGLDFSNQRMPVLSVHGLLTILFDLFILWVLLYFGLGSWENALLLLKYNSPLSWLILTVVVFLILFRSDWRADLPIVTAGYLLGYWGEWWGTTRGVWTYWNGATPPNYLPPLWGIGLLTVYRLAGFIYPVLKKGSHKWLDWGMAACFVIFPLLTFPGSWSLLSAVDWHGRLDAHFLAGLIAAVVLVLYRFDLAKVFALYLCGIILGGIYEYLGTRMGEWSYITGEVPPLWIAPLWGMAAAAMIGLASLMHLFVTKITRVLKSSWRLWFGQKAAG